MAVLFEKWVNLQESQTLIDTLIKDEKQMKKSSSHPDPFFYPVKPLHKIVNNNKNGMSVSAILSPGKFHQSTPPRSPGDIGISNFLTI